MPRNLHGVGLVCWLLVGTVGFAQTDTAANGQADDLGQVDLLESQPIANGFVILNGEYLPPPYVLKKRGDELLLNEHPIPMKLLDRGTRGKTRGGSGRSRNQPRPPLFDRLERHFNANDMLIVLDDQTAGWFDFSVTLNILDVLLSDAAGPRKVESLADAEAETDEDWVGREQWASIAATFQPTPELTERVRSLAEMFQNEMARCAALSNRTPPRSLLSSASARYVVTLLAMGLVVVAFGNLLNLHPKQGARWREVDQNGDGVGMVQRNVTLLILMGLFDLACTVAAQQAGGFLELNPLGTQMAADPLTLAAFKITTLVLSCGILLTLRRYRGAQAASWWMCLVVTVVALRWLTYNSMFLT